MSLPTNLKYTKDHEWTKTDGKIVSIGITDHAQSALGDIVFLELPKVGRELKAGETFGVVESIKAVSDLYSPVTGKVVEIHQALADEPGKINSNPYESSWMIKVEIKNPSEVEALMDSKQYSEYVSKLS
ncbi:MAG: glycine cleavage system protein GcvH [Xanthomonadaceae bacterium]|nr:glycine cleavage system protein GcvH [Xanthomonadaceae bacterium]